MWMMLVVNVILYTWTLLHTSTKNYPKRADSNTVRLQKWFIVLNYSLKCFRPLWTWFTQTYRHNVLHKTFENMKWARIMMIYIYLNRIMSSWTEISFEICMISWFWLQFSEKMTVSPSAILRSGRPDCEPQKSEGRKDLLLYESVSTAIQSDKSVLFFIIIIIIVILLSNSLLT